MTEARRTLFAQSWIQSILVVIVSGASYFLSTGLTGLRFLIWIAPIPVLWLSMRSSRRSTVTTAFCAYLLGGLNLFTYFSRIAPTGVVIASLLIPAFAFALIVVAYRDAIVHLRHPLSFVAFPVGWTAYEFLLSSLSPHGTAGSIAYTQSDFQPLMQLASLTGIFGITFVMTLIPAGIAAALQARERKNSMLILVGVACVGLACLVYGWVRLGEPARGNSVRVGLVSMDSAVGYSSTTDRGKALAVLVSYGSVVDDLAGRGAQVVVLPEKIVGVTEQYEQEAVAFFAGLARRRHVTIIAGLNRIGAEPHRNYAIMVSPDSSVPGEYDKVYPIPGLESGYRTGQSTFLVTISGTRAGMAICKDMDFQRWIRHYGEAGVGILFVPAWDFSSDAWLHSRMAIARSIENGFALVRSANNGFLTVTDDRGRVTAETASPERDPGSLLADAMPGTGRTLYAMWGDWFAWVDLLFLLILIVAVSRRLARRLTTVRP